MAISPMMLPLFMAFGTRDSARRKRLTQTLLPLAIPGPAVARAAIATFTIDREVKRSERDVDSIAKETAQVISSKKAKLTPDELKKYPALAQSVAKLKLQADVVEGEDSDDGKRSDGDVASIVKEMVKVMRAKKWKLTQKEKKKYAALAQAITKQKK